MIAITSPEQFKSASKKARELKPMVEFVKLGQYCVWGNGGDYTVRFCKDNQGRFCGECNCQAGRKNKVCYHLFVSFLSHRIQVAARRQVKAALAPSIADWTIEAGKAA